MTRVDARGETESTTRTPLKRDTAFQVRSQALTIAHNLGKDNEGTFAWQEAVSRIERELLEKRNKPNRRRGISSWLRIFQ